VQSLHGRGTTQLFFYAWLYLKMFWRAWRIRFDVVHCHDLDTLPLGFALGKLKRKPIVYDSHESFPDMLEGSVHPAVRNGLFSLENWLIRRIDLLITVGEKLRRYFEQRGARRSVVIGNWKKLEEFERTDEENLAIRRRLGIPDGALVVVCITNLLPDRKIPELLEAAAGSDVHVIIGGDGVQEALVRRAAEANPRIHYIGFVRGREIADYTCASDAVYYGFDPQNPNARFSAPNKLFEALAAGKPLITGDFGEIADVVREASCGIILSEYSAGTIREALATLEDPVLRSRFAANARQFGRSFLNWERAEQVLRRDYSALVPAILRPSAAAESEFKSSVAGAGTAPNPGGRW
jgi:glycosyltransferase involved in cell wall biosynthesis